MMSVPKLIIFCLVLFVSTITQAQMDTTFSLQAKDALVTIETSKGTMQVILYDQTPKHKQNFIHLAESGFYNGTTFHRVIAGFMIQGGDPLSKDSIGTNDGLGGVNNAVPAEFASTVVHKKGSLAGARLGDGANPTRASNQSQFYIVCENDGANHLNGYYTVFGQVVDGLSVIDKIAKVEVDQRNRPLENVSMKVSVTWLTRAEIIKKYNVDDIYKSLIK